jgi:hypothetical protein
MPKAKKNDFTIGLEHMLNNPKTSPFTAEGSKVFKEVIHASELPLTEALKYIGKSKKAPKKTDQDRSKERVERLEETSKTE